MRPMTMALGLLMTIGVPLVASAQTAGLGLRPMRLEMDAVPGQDRTMSFTIEAPPSENPVRGRLLLTLGDWRIAEDTTVSYHEPGSQPGSASPWVVLSAGDLTIASGQQRLVRVTARVPAGTAPGVYTSAIFVQERPAAEAPKAGDQRLYFRFRYVVTVYVIVSPVAPKGELEDAGLARGLHDRFELRARLSNTGTRHARPLLDWFLRCGEAQVVSMRNVDATVLMPASRSVETLVLTDPLPPGECEVEVHADFRDGRPVQAIHRAVAVGDVAVGSR